MYKIFADGMLIYDDTSSDPYLKVASPHLTLEDNAAGSLKMTIPPGNAGYETIERMKSDISVTKDGEEIWFGRVLQEEKDFWNQRVLTCEGALAFLNDTTQPQRTFKNDTGACISTFINMLLNDHNEHVSESRKIFPGAVLGFNNVSGLEVEINSEKTIECLSKFLVDQFGGHLRVRRDTASGSQTYGKLLLDYLEDYPNTTSQSVEFGKNLMDFTSSYDSSELVTVLVPLGKKLEPGEGESQEDGPDRYLTLDTYSRPDDPYNGTRYVVSSAASTYGWIEKVVHFDDISTQSDLYDAARNYMLAAQYDVMQLDLSAFDLHYLNPDIDDIFILDNIYVTSVPHGIIHKSFPVTKMDVPLDQPQNTMFQLGDTVKTSLTVETNRKNEEILHLIETSVDTDAILDAARDNATALMNLKTNGYVTIVNDANGTSALYVSETRWPEADDPNYLTHIPNRYWKWSMTGLGYTDDKGANWKTAITMDGSIVGERIAAGSIHGSKITAGTLSIVTSGGEAGLTIGLEARGLPAGSLERGTIDDEEGKNSDSSIYLRTKLKLYFTNGEKIQIPTDTNFVFEVYRYNNNNYEDSYPENGFVKPPTGTITVGYYVIPADAYYRLAIKKSDDTDITDQELSSVMAAMQDAVKLGGSAATISAQQINLAGIVTFSDIDGNDQTKTTVISGDYITTGHIHADILDLYGLTVYKKDNDGNPTSQPSFSISSKGDVYIDAQVDLSESSVIQFQDTPNMTLGAIKDAQEIANGRYSGGTFINGDTIMSPKIFADTFTATTTSTNITPQNPASFVLQRKISESSSVEAFKIYYWYNEGWEAHFAAENFIMFDPAVKFNTSVTFLSNTNASILFYSPSLFYGNIQMRGGQIVLKDDDSNPNHNGNSFGIWNNRPTNPVRGQLYFRTD